MRISDSCKIRALFIKCRALLIEFRALLMKNGLMKYGSLLLGCRTSAIHVRFGFFSEE